MGRSLSAAVAGLGAILGLLAAPAAADPHRVGSTSSFRQCIEQVAAAGPVECVVTDQVTETTTGNAEITAGIFAASLPTSRVLDIAIRFENPGCLIWNHQAAFPGSGEPANTSNPVEIVKITAPAGVQSLSLIHI